jgi:uncharacterized RDD family membrane protein YckC
MIENINIVNYASFLSRLIAYLIDIFPIYIITYIAAYFLGLYDIEFYKYHQEHIGTYSFFTYHRGGSYSTFLIWIVYSVLMDKSKYQGTHGKIIMKLKVTDNSGNRINFMQSFLRNGFKLISMFPLALGFFWILFNRQNKGWHDIVANTLVLKEDTGLIINNRK